MIFHKLSPLLKYYTIYYSNKYCYCQVKNNQKCYNSNMVSVGERLKELRIEYGVTQKELGEIVNTTKMGVSHWENGHSEPSITQLISLAKKQEEIFTLNAEEPIVLAKNDYCLRLLQRIRDEAHRFAVLYHRNLRSKHLYSELEQIPNVGKKTRQILINAFESLSAIRNATIEELEAVSGLNSIVARSVYEFYKEKREKNEI